MAQIAQVIVDVPTMQTNEPYSYAIPDALRDQLQPGMRVTVPFGHRVVSGFVVGITDDTQFAGQLKPIQAVLDLAPVLNSELQQLADWLATTTYAFRITCIQTMLPNLLKAQVEREIAPTDELTAQERATYFPDGGAREFDSTKLDAATLSGLLKLRQAGKVTVTYQVKDRAAVKTTPGITTTLPTSQLQELAASVAKRAPKQAALLTYLQRLPAQPVPQAKVIKDAGVSAEVIRAGETKGWLKRQPLEVYRDPFQQPVAPTQPLTLNDQQQAAVTAISTAVTQHDAQTFLVEGVTGSGKTEVYLQSIATALKQGCSALMLVPEIALTPQMTNRVKSRFGHQVAVLHSGLSKGEQYDEWRRIDRGEATVVVGARSAVFAPIHHLGLIIMDEEHESSYKQDENPRYHARDVALWRGRYHECPVVLGSATPSLETRARAAKGLYTRLLLDHRINHRPLPTVHIVDMREEVKQHSGDDDFSAPLMTAIQERLDRHEQVVLMLNRRGFSSFMMCRDCGFVLKCPNCDISLTYHVNPRLMKCHYCGHEEAVPQVCPNCHSRKIRYYGTGTQKVEEALQKRLPAARILRMDVDSTRRKGAHERLLKQFGRHDADILLGTQMIAKGLDFPNVTLVGVLNADTALGLPDFRASERTFQLLTQVSGRAGRAEKPGEVYIQTFNPDHYAIQLAQTQDYERFFVTEMHMRHQGNYPPYYYAIQLTASHEDEQVAAKAMYQILAAVKQGLSDQAIVLGPTPKAIARVKRKYYYQVVIKYKHEPRLKAVLDQIRQGSQRAARGLAVTIDAEPMNFM
ncbi:primosomal protein N' [Levilactobacillus zymae]|uniref:Replication restart protein PriA n=1 Tax=Levilactobacillus zymae TaxID=267363 RepID=A0A1Y6JWX9_9LACO|nr:primosomal protein N' [Levilactobacillus zymae]SMS14456.1 Helicase PriA essential for oriC/DnaA-independent DNA replication [Levilactobacillus zymae]